MDVHIPVDVKNLIVTPMTTDYTPEEAANWAAMELAHVLEHKPDLSVSTRTLLTNAMLACKGIAQ